MPSKIVSLNDFKWLSITKQVPQTKSDKHMTQTRADRIQTLLHKALSPTFLNIIDDSFKHRNHKGVAELTKDKPHNDGLNGQDHTKTHVENSAQNHQMNAETHFVLEIASDKLTGLSRVQQHKMIYDLLDDELKTGLHSLVIKVHPK